MVCELEQDKTFPGVTLFTKRNAQCIRPTAVYFPPNHAASARRLTVLLWIHGFYVKDHRFLFFNDPSRLRQQVLNSSKDVVLIAPFLGYEYAVSNGFAGNYNVKDLATPKWGERYLNQIITAISQFQSPDEGNPPLLEIGSLVIACHSGGGNGMRNIVGSLGDYRSKLIACWGFDCLYGARAAPDDATFWYQWASGPDAAKLDIVYGPSTLPQSVKLHLLGRGLVTPEGKKVEPPRPALSNLRVDIGHYDAYPAFGQMVQVNDLDPAFVESFMVPVLPNGVSPQERPRPHEDFLQRAINNVRDGFSFPSDIHYMIARGGLLSRLQGL